MTNVQAYVENEVVEFKKRNPNHRVVMASVLGSLNYGLYNRATSDIDLLVLYLPPVEDILMGIMPVTEVYKSDRGYDVKAVDIRKFTNEFQNAHLNNLQVLWSHYTHLGEYGAEYRKHLENTFLEMINQDLEPLMYSNLSSLKADKYRGTNSGLYKRLALELYNLIALFVIKGSSQDLDEDGKAMLYFVLSVIGSHTEKVLSRMGVDEDKMFNLKDLKFEGKNELLAIAHWRLFKQQLEEELDFEDRKRYDDSYVETLRLYVKQITKIHILKG